MSSVAERPPPTPERSGPDLIRMVGSTDHKRVAVRTGTAAFAFFLIAGVMALVMRAELAAPGLQVVGEDTYNQLFTMHGSTMIYLFVTPIALALGVYFAPLQVGAAEIAGPRLNLLGYWLFLTGGLVMLSGFITNEGAAKAMWTAFDPLSDSVHSPGTGMDLWIFGVVLATAGAILLAGCVLATVLARRAPGMTMFRIPVFTWSMVITCLMVVFSFPVLILAMVLLYVDRTFGDVFNGAVGAISYQHLFWFYGHPVVYVMFFPFVGAVAEVVAVFSRRRFFGYKAVVLSLLAFAALSMSVWGHHMLTTGAVANEFFALTSTALIVPAGIEYFDMIATMIGGSILLRTPMLFALGFILQFLIGGLTGIWTGSPPLDYNVHDSYFVVAHFHYTLFAGSAFGLFAGLYYWFPKVTGVLLRERLGKVHFWLMAIGANLTFFPMHFLGLDGMTRRVVDYPAGAGLTGLNAISTLGAFLIALSIAVFMYNVFVSLRHREPAGDDPWEGHTLEWATSSPPPRHNFDSLPPVHSYAPLFDLRHGPVPEPAGAGARGEDSGGGGGESGGGEGGEESERR